MSWDTAWGLTLHLLAATVQQQEQELVVALRCMVFPAAQAVLPPVVTRRCLTSACCVHTPEPTGGRWRRLKYTPALVRGGGEVGPRVACCPGIWSEQQGLLCLDNT